MNRIFWVGSFPPNMRSVGDHAQTYATHQILNSQFKDYAVIKFYRGDPNIIEKLRKSVKPNDLVFISSSGDFGDKHAYNGWHITRKQIISTFKNNRVIQLPVTVCYIKESNFEIDKSFFCDLPNFTLLVRTPQSAQLLKANFSCDIQFFPDFVFNLKPKLSQNNKKRSGVLIIMREDSEKVAAFKPKTLSLFRIMRKLEKYGLPGRAVNKTLRTLGFKKYKTAKEVSTEQNIVKEVVAKQNSVTPITVEDVMVSSANITNKVRDQEINSLLEYFSKFRIVITDRFHAAVFSALVNVPCIALPTGIPHKISGCKHLLPNTIFVDTLKELEEATKKAVDMNVTGLDYQKQYFSKFRNLVFKPKKPQTAKKHDIATDSFLSIIKNRRSTRKFNSAPIEKEKVNAILEAGIYAPSAANLQATRLKPIFNSETIKKICEHSGPWMKNSNPNVVIAVCYCLKQPNTLGINMQNKNEPWRRFIWQDTACAMQNMMLTAESLNLKTCWISIPPKRFGCQEQKLKEILNLDKYYTLACLLFIGYSNQRIDYENATHQGKKIKRNPKEMIF